MDRVPDNIDEEVRAVIRERGSISGVLRLKELTGMGLGEAKEWVEASGEGYTQMLGKCPYCECEIRTTKSKQSRHCRRDWHDESNVLVLGTNDPWTRR